MTTEMNLDLLIKLLKMTTSSNDTEALLFMRKANEQLKRAGWEWDRLLRSKVTIVADPFANMPAPNYTPRHYEPVQPAPRPQPQPAPRQSYTPPPRRQPRRRAQRVNITLDDLGL